MGYETRTNKKTGKTFVRVTVGYEANMPVRASRTFPPGTPKSHIELWVIQTKEKGLKAKAKVKTFDEVATEWLSFKKPQLAVSTHRQYSYEVKRYLLGKVEDLEGVTDEDLQALLDTYLHFSPRTLQIIRNYLRMILSYALTKGYIEKNPLTKAVMIPKLRRKKRIQVLTVEQFDLLAASLEGEELALKTMLLTGLRVSELLALQPRHIIGNALRVEQSLESRWGERIPTPPKSEHSYRTISIPEALAKNLKEIKASTFLFDKGYTSMVSSLKRKCVALGLPVMTLHGLRHSHCTYLLAKGVNVVAVSRRLGHHSPAFTLSVYSHLIPSMAKEVLEALG